MARGGKKEAGNAAPVEINPEAEERKRRKKLAFSKDIISEAQGKAFTALRPSKMVMKHHGADIIRKSQRRNRFLFSFPGILAPISGGKIGELKDLGTKNPVLYLDFPQGQMKLFGTIVYPKNRYLTLQFSRGGKKVMCEDYFDTMIVFSDAWWIGRKDDNPEETRLELPKDLHEEHAEFDFKGGAGAASEIKQSVKKSEQNIVEQGSPRTDLEDDSSDDQNNLENLHEVTPSRHSERTAGKRFNFAETSSGDDFVGDHVDVDTSGDEDKQGGLECRTGDDASGKGEISVPPFDSDNEDAAVSSHGQVQESATSITKSKQISSSNRSTLVQTTISTLFKKVEEEKAPRSLKKSPSLKAASQNLQHVGSEKKTNKVKDKGPWKRGKVIDERQAGSKNMVNEQAENPNSVESVKIYQRKTKNTTPSASVNGRASRVTATKLAIPTTSSQVDEDEIEEFSSASKDSDGSDEEWAG